MLETESFPALFHSPSKPPDFQTQSTLSSSAVFADKPHVKARPCLDQLVKLLIPETKPDPVRIAKTSAESVASVRNSEATLKLRKESVLRLTNYSLHEALHREANAFQRSRNQQRPYSMFNSFVDK